MAIDPHRAAQILRNLVQNALKFSPPGSPVDVRAHADATSVHLVVRDRGIGISQDDLEHIFDRFHQAGGAMTREREGAGLGLYITRRLVDLMGGRIEVTSAPGQGSEFRVDLPQQPLDRGSLPPPEAARAD